LKTFVSISSFLSFEKIKTQKKNDGGTHLVVWPTLFYVFITLEIVYTIYFVK